jgi:hypothetical protein
VDRDRFNPTFDIDADPNPDPTPSFTGVGGKKSELFFTFIHSDASLHCFFFIVSVLDVINLQYFR